MSLPTDSFCQDGNAGGIVGACFATIKDFCNSMTLLLALLF